MNKYKVLHDSWSAIITTDSDARTNEYYDFLGSFDTFQEAKQFAIEYVKNKIECYQSDIFQCKESIKELRKLKAKDL